MAGVATLAACSLLALPATVRAQEPYFDSRGDDDARSIQAVDGALTRPAGGDREDVAIDWVRANRAGLGLTATDVDGLDLAARSTSAATGFTHLRYRQADRGIPAFDGGVRVSLDRGGRILSATAAPAPQVDSAAPRLGPVEALRELQRDVGVERAVAVVDGPTGVRRTTRFAGGDFARLVLFGSGRGTRLAWHLTYRAGDAAHYDAVVDATSGAVLFRQNLVKDVALADVFRSHPASGEAEEVDFEPWLLGASVLNGPYAHVYSDVNDNNTFSASEEIQRTGGNFKFTFQSFTLPGCDSSALCSWDPSVATSWQANREQNGAQAFYLVNHFHDHLADDADIGFDGFADADAVQVETDDGASTGPDGDHVNNANMATLPEGIPPRMQLFLFEGFDFRSVNGGDSAAIVWHEYTHGLSNRLVVHDDGSGAVSSPQAGAMGEGWSDWYALDLLAAENPTFDTAAAGDVDLGHYVDATPHSVRRQGIDCPVGPAQPPRCPAGGYTYGDFTGAGVHDDGEIWGQTLWDLRTLVGRDLAQQLITEGMRMSPPEPSFLDMRNAILAADAGLGGGSRTAIWQAFAGRGMGYRAYDDGDDDTPLTDDFSMPPAPGGPRGITTGTVTSLEAGQPLENVTVGFESLVGEADFPDQLATRTAANGTYELDAPAGTYDELTVQHPGYEPAAVRDFTVTAGGTGVQDVALRRDWAASAGGAVVLTAGFDNSGAPFGCGLARLIDQRLESGWSAIKPSSGSAAAVVVLPQTIQVTGFGLDPANTCGNGIGASTAGYRVETSSDGASFTLAAQGTFGNADRGRLNFVPASASNARYVRVRLLSSLGPSQFIDLSELAVFSASPNPPSNPPPNPPPNRLPSGSLAASRAQLTVGGTVEFAASFTDDSRIVGYDWDFDGDGTVDRSTAESTTSFIYSRAGTFNAIVAVRDDRGGSGTATRVINVTPTPRAVVRLPSRGRRGKLTARVTCAERCSVTARMRVDGRVVRTVRRTITTTSERRIELELSRTARRAALRRHRRSVRARVTVGVRYGDGRSTTARRTVRVAL